jgi:flagellar hook-associated protein 3 FlgL
MSLNITGISDLGMASRLVTESSTIKKQLDVVTEQSATGKVSNAYSGLGANAIVSLTLNPEITEARTWQTGIDGATARMSATQNVMTELGGIASQFTASVLGMQSGTSVSVDVIAGQARDALQQVSALLNTQVGGDYIFSGNDTGNPAVPNAQSILTSNFFTQIQSAVGGLTTNGAAATSAATMAAATSPANSPFDPTIGTTAPTVEIGTQERVQTGIVANKNADAASTPSATSTGSYMLDLMRALASIGSLSSTQTSNQAAFQGFLADVSTSLKGVQTGINTDSSMLGSRQDVLATRKGNLGDMVTALTTQVSNVEDVDIAATATKLSQLQTQLQASYKLIGGLNQFSLVNFMS